MTKKKTHVITISSLKGGVGKTTFTLWLAGIYAKMNKKILIMDMDVYTGAIALNLNLKTKKNIYTLTEALDSRSVNKMESYVTKYNDNIDVLASPNDPRLASKISSQYIGTIIDRMKTLYDIILIDTNHILTDVNIVLLDYTDNVLYLVTPDPVCLRNTRSMIYIYKKMQKSNYYIVLNKSIDNKKICFSNLDIKVILKNNIDFILPDSLYDKRIDYYFLNGSLMSLDKKFINKHKKEMKKLENIANYIINKENKGIL